MKVIIATKNKGKIKEFSRILEPMGFQLISQEEAGFSGEIEETGITFAENAFLKANAIYRYTNCPTIADDSGLEVKALDNRPGVYSARYSGKNATDEQNNIKLMKEMNGINDRKAHYVCVICYIDQNGKTHYFEGQCDGDIATEPKGTEGFGYDPYFLVDGKSFGQYSAEEKDAISHRGKALSQLAKEIKGKI